MLQNLRSEPYSVKNQHTRELISSWKTSNKHNKDRNSCSCCSGLFLYSAVLHSWADSLCLLEILHEWPAFNGAFSISTKVVYLQYWHGWCHMKLLRTPQHCVLCIPYNHAACRFMQSHIHKIHACLAVTCHLHFWQNDNLLCASAAMGWNGYQNMSRQRKLTLEKKPLLPLLHLLLLKQTSDRHLHRAAADGQYSMWILTFKRDHWPLRSKLSTRERMQACHNHWCTVRVVSLRLACSNFSPYLCCAMWQNSSAGEKGGGGVGGGGVRGVVKPVSHEGYSRARDGGVGGGGGGGTVKVHSNSTDVDACAPVGAWQCVVCVCVCGEREREILSYVFQQDPVIVVALVI